MVVVGFLAGIITSISPCVLPVLPVTYGRARRSRNRRVASFSVRPAAVS